MLKKACIFLLGAVMLSLIVCLPLYAQSNPQKIIEIANNTYEKNLNQLTPEQRQLMQDILRNIEYRIPEDPEGHISMSYMAMVTGGTDKKAQAVVAAWGVQKYPESVCLINNLGYALFLLKDYENAVEIFKQALEMDGKKLETLVNLGNVYLDMDNDEEAKVQYEKAIKIDKEYFKAWEGLFGYYMKKKEVDKAMEIAKKILPGGFVQRGKDKMQRRIETQGNEKKLDCTQEGDSLEVMGQKIDKISNTKPLTLAPIVEEIDPVMAQKIREEMENLKVTVQAPKDPWPIKYTNAKEYYVTSSAYGEVSLFSEASSQINIDPTILEKARQFQGMSEGEINSMVENYINDISDLMDKIQDINPNSSDYSQLMGIIDEIAKGPKPPAVHPPTVPGQQITDPPASSPTEELGIKEKDGMVSKSNYYNYQKHQMNFRKYFQKICREFEKGSKVIGDNFHKEMSTLVKRQENSNKPMDSPDFIRARNRVRDKYVEEFGQYLATFYRSHVMPAIEKYENTQALYIKNMANKKLKNSQAEQMKVEINRFLEIFAKAKAPIDAYEAESDAVARAIEEQIERVKANAPNGGQTIPQLKTFEERQRSLLDKIYEDTKFESQVGLVKLTYENAELTIAMNDPINDKYMDLGVSLKDLSASLTEGEGSEFGFTVNAGKYVDASVGVSNRQPGQKTTIYFDSNFNPVDAQITQTSGSQGVSVGLGAFDVGIEGGVKIESTAEGTSKFVSSIKSTYNNLTLWEELYKEEL